MEAIKFEMSQKLCQLLKRRNVIVVATMKVYVQKRNKFC